MGARPKIVALACLLGAGGIAPARAQQSCTGRIQWETNPDKCLGKDTKSENFVLRDCKSLAKNEGIFEVPLDYEGKVKWLTGGDELCLGMRKGTAGHFEGLEAVMVNCDAEDYWTVFTMGLHSMPGPIDFIGHNKPGKEYVLNVRLGDNQEGAQIETWEKFPDDPNQQFTIEGCGAFNQPKVIESTIEVTAAATTTAEATATSTTATTTTTAEATTTTTAEATITTTTEAISMPVAGSCECHSEGQRQGFIRWGQHAEMCLDVFSALATNGNNIQLFSCNPEQEFIISGSGPGQIRWAHAPEKCLDVESGAQGGNFSGNNLQLWDCLTEDTIYWPNQQFEALASGHIRWANSSLCLSITRNENKNGTNIQLQTCDETTTTWCLPCPAGDAAAITTTEYVAPVTDEHDMVCEGHILWNLHPKMCVDVVAAASDNGNNVQLWDCDSAPTFTVPKSGSGQIKWARHPEKCLDVDKGVGRETQDGINLHLWECKDKSSQYWPNQQFEMLRHPGVIRWAGTSKCIDVSAGIDANGTNIQLWECDESQSAQLFNVETCSAAKGVFVKLESELRAEGKWSLGSIGRALGRSSGAVSGFLVGMALMAVGLLFASARSRPRVDPEAIKRLAGGRMCISGRNLIRRDLGGGLGDGTPLEVRVDPRDLIQSQAHDCELLLEPL